MRSCRSRKMIMLLILSILLFIYLFYVLINPEKF
ncbi:MAG: K(+)-transporting ATPase subunit F [Ignavibacteriales bacterium]|nr:K(+)-transporting ATPase subunit F [Ignavibacteriales bacterium]MBK8661867.1 K(+)-transporting ATPase subunit F [Ignavibacteriales bacterium]MBP9123110.1 K(+)-transporting ATPase subunit F [Ignavibacteriaceae bacterium]MCC6637292.1 K(+)-transporting ATPase subunit F [Ignavibacteriaceae bacterium]